MSLTYGTLRYHMARQLRLASQVGAQLFTEGESQYEALARGAAVVLTREQLQMFSHPSIPASLDHEAYTLTGDDTLTPAS